MEEVGAASGGEFWAVKRVRCRSLWPGHCSLVFLVASLRGAAVNVSPSPLAAAVTVTASGAEARWGQPLPVTNRKKLL